MGDTTGATARITRRSDEIFLWWNRLERDLRVFFARMPDDVLRFFAEEAAFDSFVRDTAAQMRKERRKAGHQR
jgi:hypothetical protein